MTPGVSVPVEVEAALRAEPLVGDLRRIRPTIGGFSNLTFYGDMTGGDTVLVKCASREVKRADLRREVRMLSLLHDSDLRPPTVRAHINTGSWTVTVTDAVAGDIGINIVQTRDVPELRIRAEVMARLLQALHRVVPGPVDDPDLDCGLRMHKRFEELSKRSLPEEVRVPIRSLVDPLLRRGNALVHGDFGFHNTIWSTGPDGPIGVCALLDWEWSGWGHPLTDAAWMWWTLHFRQSPPETWEAFVATYGDSALRDIGWSAGNVDTVLKAQMAWILSCTEPGSPAEREWCVRMLKLDELQAPAL